MVDTNSRGTRDRAVLGNKATGIRAVLFDFGGVLSSSPFEAFAHYEAEAGLPEGFLRGLNARDHHENAWAQLERGELTLEAFGTEFEAEALEAGYNVRASDVLSLLRGELRPSMIEAVRRCRSSYLTGLATNNFVSLSDQPANGRVDDVMSLFDEVVESSRIGSRKPEPSFFHTCCTRLGIEPHEAVFIDDLGVNLKPARELGMTTIKFVSEPQALADLEAALKIPLR